MATDTYKFQVEIDRELLAAIEQLQERYKLTKKELFNNAFTALRILVKAKERGCEIVFEWTEQGMLKSRGWTMPVLEAAADRAHAYAPEEGTVDSADSPVSIPSAQSLHVTAEQPDPDTGTTTVG